MFTITGYDGDADSVHRQRLHACPAQLLGTTDVLWCLTDGREKPGPDTGPVGRDHGADPAAGPRGEKGTGHRLPWFG